MVRVADINALLCGVLVWISTSWATDATYQGTSCGTAREGGVLAEAPERHFYNSLHARACPAASRNAPAVLVLERMMLLLRQNKGGKTGVISVHPGFARLLPARTPIPWTIVLPKNTRTQCQVGQKGNTAFIRIVRQLP
jgi:hypothetical protein